jgi:hypothetical protein
MSIYEHIDDSDRVTLTNPVEEKVAFFRLNPIIDDRQVEVV